MSGRAPGRSVVEVTRTPLDLELTEPFSIATGAQHVAKNVLVRVRLEDGTVGLGEAAPFPAVSGETQESTLDAIDSVKALVEGADAARYRDLARRLDRSIHEAPAARAGIEQAVFDALARHARLPLWGLFGGACAPLETDMTITAGDVTHAVASARNVLARGISTLKVKVGATGPDEDADRLGAIHRAVPEARIVIDANGGYDAGAALALLADLARRGVPIALFEQPVPASDLDGLTRVTREGGVMVCADESARSPEDVLAIVKRGAAHAINIKLMKCGVVAALEMWSIAEAAGLGRMIGGMVESILAMSFSAHFAHGLGGFTFVDLDTPLFIRSSPFTGGFALDGAKISLDGLDEGAGVSVA